MLVYFIEVYYSFMLKLFFALFYNLYSYCFCVYIEQEMLVFNINVFFQYSFENLFRSLQYALLDACCREYHFVCDFFMLSGDAAQDLFNAIMGKALAVYLVSSSHCTTFYLNINDVVLETR